MSYKQIVQESLFNPRNSRVSNTSSASRRTGGLNLTYVNSSKVNLKEDQDIFYHQLNRVELDGSQINKAQPLNINNSDPAYPKVYQNKESIFYSLGTKRQELPQQPTDYRSVSNSKNWHLCDLKEYVYLREMDYICDTCLNNQYLCRHGQCSSICVERKANLLESQNIFQKTPTEMDKKEWIKYYNQSTGSTIKKRDLPCVGNQQVSFLKNEPGKKHKPSISKCYCQYKGCSQNHCGCKSANLKCSNKCVCFNCQNCEVPPQHNHSKVIARPETSQTLVPSIFNGICRGCTDIEEEGSNQMDYEVSFSKKSIKFLPFNFLTFNYYPNQNYGSMKME